MPLMKPFAWLIGSIAMLGAYLSVAAGASVKEPEADRYHIEGLDPLVRNFFRRLMARAYQLSPEARISSSRRTVAEQNALYALGRTKPGSIVTNASGCKSWHVHGRAIDIEGLTASQLRTLGAFWKELGGKWGGDFRGFSDMVHFEFHPDVTLEALCP